MLTRKVVKQEQFVQVSDFFIPEFDLQDKENQVAMNNRKESLDQKDVDLNILASETPTRETRYSRKNSGLFFE